MTTPANPPAPALTDIRTLAIEALQALGTTIDTILGDASTELPTLTSDGLNMAVSLVENLVPAGPIRTLVTTILTTANAAAHAALMAAVDAPALALLVVAKANVDAALKALEATLSGSSSAPVSTSESHTSS